MVVYSDPLTSFPPALSFSLCFPLPKKTNKSVWKRCYFFCFSKTSRNQGAGTPAREWGASAEGKGVSRLSTQEQRLWGRAMRDGWNDCKILYSKAWGGHGLALLRIGFLP